MKLAKLNTWKNVVVLQYFDGHYKQFQPNAHQNTVKQLNVSRYLLA